MSQPNITTINCCKLKKSATALATAPYPGELGQRILKEISAEAWQLWLERQTMLINEYRLSVIEKPARKFIEQAMVDFLFNDIDAMPDGYKPE